MDGAFYVFKLTLREAPPEPKRRNLGQIQHLTEVS